MVLLPSAVLKSAATATADMLAALRLAVSGTDVASISWSLGEHYFTRAQAGGRCAAALPVAVSWL